VIPKVPGIYFKLYDDKLRAAEIEEEELDWIVPQTEGDVQAMLSELRNLGVNAG
jgi:hypothetical protein